VSIPLVASLLIVFGAPYVGDIRGALQSSAPEHYRLIIGLIVATAVAGALVAAAATLRRSHQGPAISATHPGYPGWLRYALLAAAAAIGVVYALTVSTGNPDVDLVEAFHFVQYGLVTFLFYRASRRRTDVGAVVVPACASLLVGVADEWMQWFVPGRVGELHDVWLNAVAIVCGVLVSVAVHPPASLALPTQRSSRVALAAAAGVLILAGAGFVDRVHLGYEIADEQIGVFRSRSDARMLRAAAGERPARWRQTPPPQRGFAREDHYLSEGLWHVQRRNTAITDGDAATAWAENLILEKYYAPVLDRGSRLSPGERSDIERRVPTVSASFVSSAQPYPIYIAPRGLFWTTTTLAIAALLWSCLGSRASRAVSRAA
jgi:VanZ family protein